MSLGFENLFCLQICLDSFIFKVTVRLYIFCFGLKITICLVWCMCDASPRKKRKKKQTNKGLFLKLRSTNFRLTQFWWIYYKVFYIPPTWKWQSSQPDNWFLRWQDWIAFEELHRPLFREHGSIYFSNVNKPSKDMNYAFCEVCSLFSPLEGPFL